MRKPVINLADITLEPRPSAFAPSGKAAERFDAKMGFISPHVGAQKLGYNLTAVPPGKSAFPSHNHNANEEMFFVLQGTGELRVGEDTYPIGVGDVIACPPGGEETAHQIVNSGQEELRYLAVSTRTYPELVTYPNSGKFGVLAEWPANSDGQPKGFMYVGREGESIDYWEGE